MNGIVAAVLLALADAWVADNQSGYRISAGLPTGAQPLRWMDTFRLRRMI